MSARIGSTWKKFRELSGALLGKQDEARLHGVERRIKRMMCRMRLVNRVSTDVF